MGTVRYSSSEAGRFKMRFIHGFILIVFRSLFIVVDAQEDCFWQDNGIVGTPVRGTKDFHIMGSFQQRIANLSVKQMRIVIFGCGMDLLMAQTSTRVGSNQPWNQMKCRLERFPDPNVALAILAMFRLPLRQLPNR